MDDKIELHWWGQEICLSEQSTQDLLSTVSAGGTVEAFLAGILASDPASKGILAAAGAYVALGSQVIAAVDRKGGAQGVCLYQPWIFTVAWVKARNGARAEIAEPEADEQIALAERWEAAIAALEPFVTMEDGVVALDTSSLDDEEAASVFDDSVATLNEDMSQNVVAVADVSLPDGAEVIG